MASGVTSSGSGRVGNRVRIAAFAVASSLVLAASAGCSTPHRTLPTNGDRVVVLATATVHEPRPMLTDRALAQLRNAAESTNVSDGHNARGSVARVTTADGQFSSLLPLTPRDADGNVEHGLRRNSLIDDNLRVVSDTVIATTARRPGLDLLQGMDDAVAGSDHGVLIVVSNGLSTRGGFDLRQTGWNAEPEWIVAKLRERDLLPDLSGWRVLFTGLGATAGDQPPLPRTLRKKLAAYWMAICTAAADFCEVDHTRFDRTAPLPGPGPNMPIVPVPVITSVTGPHSAG